MKKKRWYILGGGLLLAAAVLIGAALWIQTHPAETAETRVQAAVAEHVAERAAPPASTAPGPEDTPAPEATEPPYESPVDFPSLWEMNSEIYAWLYIPGTEVNYPILQREGNDKFYLNHNSQGRYSDGGAVFTESAYNSKDFTDPVTLVYGHYMRSGTMFGSLQATYTAENGMAEHQEIIVYLPEQELHYQVFAAVPFNMRHILYYNDFRNRKVFEAFLEQVMSVRSINASIDGEAEVTAEDQLLILSTCLRGDSKQRYLVLAKRMADISAP